MAKKVTTPAKKYVVLDKFKGKTTYAKAPAYERKDGGKFILDECNQKDLHYLARRGFDGVQLED